MGNSYTASVTVGGALEALYLSLAGAEALTYLMTGGSMSVSMFGTVISGPCLGSVVQPVPGRRPELLLPQQEQT